LWGAGELIKNCTNQEEYLLLASQQAPKVAMKGIWRYLRNW